MIDEGGNLYVLGRKRAMIKRAGSTIAPREIEEVVDEVDGVLASAALGVRADTDLGADRVVVVAEVREPSDLLVRQIGERVRSSVGFLPDEIILDRRGAIPRTANGKIRYDDLRARFDSGRTST